MLSCIHIKKVLLSIGFLYLSVSAESLPNGEFRFKMGEKKFLMTKNKNVRPIDGNECTLRYSGNTWNEVKAGELSRALFIAGAVAIPVGAAYMAAAIKRNNADQATAKKIITPIVLGGWVSLYESNETIQWWYQRSFVSACVLFFLTFICI